ncbi:MAG: hypothetical protein SGPRY_009404 [Prymnesium sp.]
MRALALVALPLVVCGICNDMKPECGHWAKEGYCTSNPEVLVWRVAACYLVSILRYMTRICPLSCVVCNHTCADQNATCISWALNGECDANPDFMLRNCPTSCGICTPMCEDSLPECAGWAHLGECTKNPDFTARKCPVSCGICKPKCKDTESDCPGWAAAGECESNTPFMYKTCPASCDVCSKHPDGKCVDVSNSTACTTWERHGECINSECC